MWHAFLNFLEECASQKSLWESFLAIAVWSFMAATIRYVYRYLHITTATQFSFLVLPRRGESWESKFNTSISAGLDAWREHETEMKYFLLQALNMSAASSMTNFSKESIAIKNMRTCACFQSTLLIFQRSVSTTRAISNLSGTGFELSALVEALKANYVF